MSLSTDFNWFILAIFINVAFFVIPTTLLYRMREIDIIKKRGLALTILLSTVTCIASCSLFSYLTCFLQFQQECFLFVFILNAGVPIILYAYVIKSFTLVYENCRTRIAFSDDVSESIKVNAMERFTDYYFSFFRSKKRFQPSISTLEKRSLSIRTRFIGEISNIEQVRALIPVVILSLSLVVIVFPILKNDLLVLHGCPNFLIYMPVVVCLSVGVLLIPAILYSIFYIEDGLGLKNELVYGFATASIEVVFIILGFFFQQVNVPLFGNGFFALLVCYNSHIVSVIVPVFQAYFHVRRLSKLKHSVIDFKEMKIESDLFRELKKLMVKEHCIENALFLEELDRGVKRMNALGSTNILVDTGNKKMWVIYHKYIEEGAPFQINVPHKSGKRIKMLLNGVWI